MATTPSFDATPDGLDGLAEGGLLFASSVKFDTSYGHRRDVAGYAAAFEGIRCRTAATARSAAKHDLLIMTADQGCDPT
jgi:phosphopentomutase